MSAECPSIDCCPETMFAYEVERPLVFAMVGDYGMDNQSQADVVALMKSWEPEFIVTVGDNQYLGSPSGSAAFVDQIIGQYFRMFIHPYIGSYPLGAGEVDADENRLFTAMGNHDLDTLAGAPLTDYLALPGNERYYEFIRGHAHFFILNSGLLSNGTTVVEPDGITFDSAQGEWLTAAMAASTARWKFAVVHQPPYTSGGGHGPTLVWRWPQFSGLDALFSGHNHVYERLDVDGLTAIVIGNGGTSLRPFGTIVPESVLRYNSDYGAIRAEITRNTAKFQHITRTGLLIDEWTLT